MTSANYELAQIDPLLRNSAVVTFVIFLMMQDNVKILWRHVAMRLKIIYSIESQPGPKLNAEWLALKTIWPLELHSKF